MAPRFPVPRPGKRLGSNASQVEQEDSEDPFEIDIETAKVLDLALSANAWQGTETPESLATPVFWSTWGWEHDAPLSYRASAVETQIFISNYDVAYQRGLARILRRNRDAALRLMGLQPNDEITLSQWRDLAILLLGMQFPGCRLENGDGKRRSGAPRVASAVLDERLVDAVEAEIDRRKRLYKKVKISEAVEAVRQANPNLALGRNGLPMSRNRFKVYYHEAKRRYDYLVDQFVVNPDD